MLKNKKIIIPLVVLLILGSAATIAMAKFPKPAVAKEKIEGTIYILPKEFLREPHGRPLRQAHRGARAAPGQSDGAAAGRGRSRRREGFGTLPEEAAVRDIITNVLTNAKRQRALSDQGRRAGQAPRSWRPSRSSTDVKVDDGPLHRRHGASRSDPMTRGELQLAAASRPGRRARHRLGLDGAHGRRLRAPAATCRSSCASRSAARR